MIATRWRHRSLLFVALILTVAVMAPQDARAQSREDVERADAARDRAYNELVETQAELDAAVAAYEEVRSEIFDVSYRLDRLETRIGEDRASATELEEAARQVVVEAYMNGSTGTTFTIALEANTIQDVVTSQALFERANAISLSALDRLDAVSRELDRLSVDLDDDRAELQELESIAELAVTRVDELLAQSQRLFDRRDAAAQEALAKYRAEQARLRALEAARRAARAGVYGYLRCPSGNPYWFRNDWGNPRSGGRRHKGTDIFAPKGTAVFAVTAGSVRIRNGGLGGKAIWLYGSDGNAYYYAHLNSWRVSSGARVNKGQVIATVGNTGNASGGANHTHFQLHPRGGAPRNPYPTLAAIC